MAKDIEDGVRKLRKEKREMVDSGASRADVKKQEADITNEMKILNEEMAKAVGR